jgi:hypothetical protein
MTSSTKGAIIGGCVGLAVMFAIIESDVSASWLTLLLWPSSVFGTDFHDEGKMIGLVVGSIEVGVQFLAYAALGWVIGAIVRIARREG